jgi:ABC-2 type transport system ATP-binding protein
MDPERIALRVESIGVRAGDRWFVRDAAFEAHAGEIVAVIGPNGAGKTTLLEALVGLRSASAGIVQARGRPISSFADRAAAFAYLPDEAAPAYELTAGDAIAHALSCRPRDAGLLRGLRRRLEIAPLLGTSLGRLSRGERRRVELFATLALDRGVVVLDEPFGVFDPVQLEEVFAAIRAVAAQDVAVVAALHQLAQAEKIADRILLLAAGRVVAFGSLSALRDAVGDSAASLERIFFDLLRTAAR